MLHVATLVAAPAFDGLADLVPGLARTLRAEPLWLDAGVAVDLAVPGAGPAEIAAAVRDAIGKAPVDHAVQAAFGRRKRLLIADMDSTFITVECIDVLAARAGIGAEIAAITQATIRGELEFGQSLRERVARMAGLPLSLFETAWSQDIGFMPGGATVLATMRAHGALTALVSGGFTWFTGRVAATLGFDLHRANDLLIEAGALTGALAEPILDRGAKQTILDELVASQGLSMAETLAVGDGANDVDMLAAAGLGVAYHGVALAEAAADAAIRHNDLTALLFYQGYRRADVVSAEPRPA